MGEAGLVGPLPFLPDPTLLWARRLGAVHDGLTEPLRFRALQSVGAKIPECRFAAAALVFDPARRRYAPSVTTIDLRRLRLRPGDVRRERLELALEPFLLGWQRYEPAPTTLPVELEISQASGASVFDLRLDAHLTGPCMRCLGFAEVERRVSAREFHDPDAPLGDGLRSDYVASDHLNVGAWARDAIALGLPDQILCRPDCAGLCPVCGKDLNVEPHEHAEREPDPRWAALGELRDQL